MKRSARAAWKGGLRDGKGTVSFHNVNGAWTVTSSHLETGVKSPNADPTKSQKAAEEAKAGCPIEEINFACITMISLKS